MGDYIKRDFALDVVKRTSGDYAAAWAEIAHASAADVAPVVHGKWKGYTCPGFYGCDEFGDPVYRDTTIYYCSECNRRTVIKEKYCPNCGAKMDKEDTDQ